MAEEIDIGYTSIDFLSKLKVSPKKKKVINSLSLNTDIQEINLLLNTPAARVDNNPTPSLLDVQKTKTFVLSLLSKYQKVQEAEKKWEGFLQSVNSPLQFQKYVSSLKQIAPSPKVDANVTNPESTGQVQDAKLKVQNRKTVSRSFSSKRLQTIAKTNKGPKAITTNKLRELLKEQISQLKDLLVAGEKFIRSV